MSPLNAIVTCDGIELVNNWGRPRTSADRESKSERESNCDNLFHEHLSYSEFKFRSRCESLAQRWRLFQLLYSRSKGVRLSDGSLSCGTPGAVGSSTTEKMPLLSDPL